MEIQDQTVANKVFSTRGHYSQHTAKTILSQSDAAVKERRALETLRGVDLHVIIRARVMTTKTRLTGANQSWSCFICGQRWVRSEILNVADLGNKGEDGNDGLRQEHQNEHGSADDENENC
jgi:hypothetical protein